MTNFLKDALGHLKSSSAGRDASETQARVSLRLLGIFKKIRIKVIQIGISQIYIDVKGTKAFKLYHYPGD